jgi:hypothetical protein
MQSTKKYIIFNMIIWFYLIYLKSWHQYCWFLAKHCHLVTKQIRICHGDYFNVTITNYSRKRKEKKMAVV